MPELKIISHRISVQLQSLNKHCPTLKCIRQTESSFLSLKSPEHISYDSLINTSDRQIHNPPPYDNMQFK